MTGRTHIREPCTNSVIEVLCSPEQVPLLGQLKNTFGMGKREAEAVLQEVTVKVYRRMLAQAVQGGALEAAPSKAAYLQNLCDTLQFDPAKAGQVHEGVANSPYKVVH